MQHSKSKQRITPFLWFNGQAEEAVNFYLSIFKNSKLKTVTYYPEGTPNPAGTVMTVVFELDGQEFIALNGGPRFTFNEAVSFVVNCDTQKELDRFWTRLSEGGQVIECGWLKDKYGVTWQIVPKILRKLLQDKGGEKSYRVLQAILKMKKIDIQTLKQAYSSQAKPKKTAKSK
jgi:predicted 3-demethylubiquinone-9 3-methyltransferase (glyoxalase superfamily)